jgi:hypothetical protein
MSHHPEQDSSSRFIGKPMKISAGLLNKAQRWIARLGTPLLLLFFFYLSFSLLPAAQNSGQTQKSLSRPRSVDDPAARERWFYGQRAYPRAEIPAGARERALERLDEMIRARQVALGRTAALAGGALAGGGSGTWTAIGPQPSITGGSVGSVSGRVTAIAVDLTDNNTAYIGGAFGGVWKTTDGGFNWTPITESEITQAVGSIAIDPSSCSPGPCQTIYVGTGEENFAIESYYGAGILKSTNGGQSWTRLGTPPGAPFTGPFSGQFTPGGGARIGSIAVNPMKPNILLAAVQILSNPASSTSGIYCSGDGGTTWNVIPAASNAPGIDVVFASSTIAYASLGRTRTGTNGANGVYKSVNADQACAAQTWTRTNLTATGGSTAPPFTPPIDPTSTGRISLAVAPGTPTTLYAGVQDPRAATFGSLLGFYKSVDGGTNWTSPGLTPDYCNPQCWYDNVVRVDPRNANVVYVGGSAKPNYLARSTDGGSSWAAFPVAGGNRLHVDQHAIAFGLAGGTPTLYVGNDGGVWKSLVANPTDTPSWVNLNGVLNITQFYPGFSTHPSTPQQGIGGTQDNGTILYSGNLDWRETDACGDGGWTIIDPVVPTTYYVSCEDIFLSKSVHSGAIGTYAPADIPIPSDNVSFIPPFVLDASNHSRLYFGTYRLFQSTDGALSWNPISVDLTGGGGSAAPGPTLTTIRVAPSSSQVVYTGSLDGCVRVSINVAAGSATFSPTCLGSGVLPGRAVTQVTVDPADPNTAYVTFSGFSNCTPPAGVAPCDGLGHVFKTSNIGSAWTDITGVGGGRLPDTPVNDLVIDPDDPTHNTLYAGTDIGVFQTIDIGTNWTALNPATPGNPGLPRVTVQSLQLHNPSRTLRAATHGRGVWDLVLANLPTSPTFRLSSIVQPSTATVTASAGSFTLTVAGQGFTPPSSIIRWNGSTTGVTQAGGTATQLSATIGAGLLTGPGVAQITVSDPNPLLGTTNALPLTVAAPPSNDNFANAMNLTLGANNKFAATVVDSSNATVEFTVDPIPTCTAGLSPPASQGGRANSVWYMWTATASGTLTVDTSGSQYDTILVAVTGAQGSFAQQLCNDDFVLGTIRTSSGQFSVTAGVTYFFMVSAYTGDGGPTSLNGSLSLSPPDFTVGASPASANASPGGSATYTVRITPTNGFTGVVTPSCTSLPTVLSCGAFNPTTITPGTTPNNSATVTVTASAAAQLPGAPSLRGPFDLRPTSLWLLGVLVSLAMAAIWWAGRSPQGARQRIAVYVALSAVVLFLAIQLAGCSKGASSGGGGTPARNYTVTFTGTAGATTHSTSATLVVQ